MQVDLQTPEGKEILHKLIAKADVLSHNFRPGVAERLQIDWETCRRFNPRLVYSWMGTYGERHPLVVSARNALQELRARLKEETNRALKQLEVQMHEAQASEVQLQARLDELTSIRGRESRMLPQLRQLESEQTALVNNISVVMVVH